MNLEQARTNMVEQQIRTWEVLDQDVLDLLYTVPREEFVPPSSRNLAFTDMEIPLGNNAGEGAKMWAPKMEARVLQELLVDPGHFSGSDQVQAEFEGGEGQVMLEQAPRQPPQRRGVDPARLLAVADQEHAGHGPTPR